MKTKGEGIPEGILTIWHVSTHAANSQVTRKVVKLGLSFYGERLVNLERVADKVLSSEFQSWLIEENKHDIVEIVSSQAEKLLNRELSHVGLLNDGVSYISRLLGCIVIK